MVRTAKGALSDQFAFAAVQSCNRVQADDFQSFLHLQRGKQCRHLMGQCGFAAAGWTHQQEVMASSSGNGEALSCELLTRKRKKTVRGSLRWSRWLKGVPPGLLAALMQLMAATAQTLDEFPQC